GSWVAPGGLNYADGEPGWGSDCHDPHLPGRCHNRGMSQSTPGHPADRNPEQPPPAASDAPHGHGGQENAAALTESRDRGSFTRYRVMAFITGTFLLLLVLEMFLKYALQLNGVLADGSAAPVL